MGATIKRYIHANGKNCINIPGVDFGTYIEVIKETELGLLCKRGGHNGWCGIGEYRYYEPEFIVFEKVEENEVKECMGRKSFIYNRNTKKEAFKKALETLNDLKNLNVQNEELENLNVQNKEDNMRDFNSLKRKKNQLELQIVHLEKELDKKSKKLKEIDIELRRLEEKEDTGEMCLDG